ADFATLALGAGQRARFSTAFPLDPALVGLRYFQQAAVPDPTANAAGAVMSDASAAVVGR
ncbi:MAG: hypothetical protein KDE27_08305, partial [Planctomycetes bacterium]|nr:hypothetical protein [Planctomycetota bacterium]